MAQQIFGARAGVRRADTGVRRVASTYGKAAYFTHAEKSAGTIVVESESERLVSQLLSFDPNIRSYSTQPLTVDLVGGTILRTAEEKKATRARYKGAVVESSFYTPDFLVSSSLGTQMLIEVKADPDGHPNSPTYGRLKLPHLS